MPSDSAASEKRTPSFHKPPSFYPRPRGQKIFSSQREDLPAFDSPRQKKMSPQRRRQQTGSANSSRRTPNQHHALNSSIRRIGNSARARIASGMTISGSRVSRQAW